MEGYAESSCFNHFDIVRPVTDRERFGRLQAFFIADTRQGIQFRGSPENRLLDFTSQLLVLKHQLVSIMVVKPNAFGDTTCEKRFEVKFSMVIWCKTSQVSLTSQLLYYSNTIIQ